MESPNSLRRFHSPHAPAVFTLVADAGKQGDAVPRRRFGIAVVQLGDLFDLRHRVGALAELRRQRDRIAEGQRMDVAEYAVCSPVVVE